MNPYSSLEVGETAQWVKVLVAKADDLDLIPRTHVVKTTNSHKLPSDLNMSAMAQMPLHKK